MPIEVCPECGFDGNTWTDSGAVTAIAALAGRWSQAVDGLSRADMQRRPIVEMWSIAEYVDHVRETLFGMRFLLDTAVSDPGAELGAPPDPRFAPEPRLIAVPSALVGLASEAQQLHHELRATPRYAWASTVVVRGEELDLHWIARHAVHDPTHHLGDVVSLRASL